MLKMWLPQFITALQCPLLELNLEFFIMYNLCMRSPVKQLYFELINEYDVIILWVLLMNKSTSSIWQIKFYEFKYILDWAFSKWQMQL